MSSRMALDSTIAFIGAGNMAGALIRGLLGTSTVTPDQIIASDPDEARRTLLSSELGVRTTPSNEEALRGANVVMLATKPQAFRLVLPDVEGALKPDALIISIAAGISTKLIEKQLPAGTHVVRSMPNTPALVGAGATAIAGGANATEADLALAEKLFESVGVVVRVPERQLDAVTALSGSGPAYVFAMIEALRDAAVREGLPEDVSLRLAAQTVWGAARLLLERGESPEALRDKVTSPGGTTRAGLDALESAGFADSLGRAVRAATRRSEELRKIAEDVAED
jgi:pyrroline-5-carboxylate reductase